MGRFNKKEMPMWAKSGHKAPVTRRDFLSAGLIPFAASVMMPSALNLLVSPEAAADTGACATGGGGLAAFITVNMSGGPGMAANFLPRAADGSLLTSYSILGGGTSSNVNPQTEFGVPAFSSTSQLLQGIRNVASANSQPNILSKTAFAAMCVQSRDDSGANTLDASGLVYAAGLKGSKIPNLGTLQGLTGINQSPATMSPPAPLIVSSFTDLANSVGYTPALASSLTQKQRTSLTSLVQSLTGSQARKLASINSGAQLQSLIDCAGINNPTLISQGSGAVDPLQQSAGSIGTIWGFNASTKSTTQGRVFGSMVYNALVGNSGSASFDLGGYDYHDGTRTTGDAKDLQAGMVIGQILASADALQKPVFVYVIADGATGSDASDSPGSVWRQDRGTGSAALMFMYNPAGRPKMTNGDFSNKSVTWQIGQYTQGQVADTGHVVGANPEIAAQAALANYLAFNNQLSVYSSVITGGTLTGPTMQGVLRVAAS